jgi:hypothetical protein
MKVKIRLMKSCNQIIDLPGVVDVVVVTFDEFPNKIDEKM